MMKSIIILVISVLLLACNQAENFDSISSLDEIKKRGTLIVLTTNTPTTYFYDRDNQLAGAEYTMTQAFAKSLHLDVEYKVYNSTKDLLNALRNNKGDIAASSLTINQQRKKEFDFGPAYLTTNELLVCHRSKNKIKDKSELNNIDITVAADTTFIESLKAYPDMSWTINNDLNTTDLIELVAQNKIQCTIADSILYNIERRYHTEIQNKYTLAKESQLAWMLNKNNNELKQAVNDWFEQYKEENELSYMLEKYYGYVEIFDYVDIHKFLKRIETRLPKYKEYFIDAATKNGLQASLLAAQSYQESHWNPKAKSPTGVRGIMMLTQPVAKSLGVTSRLDAKQNIYAGAKFQAKMKKMVEHVSEPDRTWLALAAYNVGRGHFRDAQGLARKLNKNPDRWYDMKEVLPLLSQKKYYKDLRYGYARGNEPVRYVTRIRGYDALLHRHFDEMVKQ